MELKERLDKIKSIIEQDSFFKHNSLGGELNFHIFDYNPEDELIVRGYIDDFMKSYDYENSKIKPIQFDLFEMILNILSKFAGSTTMIDRAIDIELKQDTEKLFKALSGPLKPEKFIEIIKQDVAGHNLVIITGVGKAYPLIRSHTILNNLHSVLDDVPVIMFYPGRYDQKDLRLFKNNVFDGLKDDNYYRAFKLVES